MTLRLLGLALLFLLFTSRAPADPPLVAEAVEQPRPLYVGAARRIYYVHIPRSYNPQKPVPLVLLLHGRGGSATEIEAYTRMGEKADQAGFILACPQAAGDIATWSVGFNSGMKDNSDVLFLTTLIDRLRTLYAIDPRRVYVAGHSSGGMMAYRLAAEHSEKIAAIGVVAGTIGAHGESGQLTIIPHPSHPVSVIAFHGTKDPAMPYASTDTWALNHNFLPAMESVAFWAHSDGCGLTAQHSISKNGHILVDSFSGGKGGSEAVLYTVVEGDHWWPGDRDAAPYVPPVDEEISATDLMWEFFSRHPGPEEKPAGKV